MPKFKTEAELEAWEAEQERLAEAEEGETTDTKPKEPEDGYEDEEEDDSAEEEPKKPAAPEVEEPKKGTDAAPDANDQPEDKTVKGLLREITKLRDQKRSLYDEIAALRSPGQQKAPEEVEKELEERFLEKPGEVLRELREMRSTEDRGAVEEKSVAKAVEAYTTDGFNQRYAYLDDLAKADPEFKRQYIDPIVERHPDPAIALMRLADTKIAESPEYQDFIVQQRIQEGINDGLKKLTKDQLKKVLSGNDEPGIDGVGGRPRPANKVSDLPYEKRRKLSEAELERAAEEDD